jgi:hypothetical protein
MENIPIKTINNINKKTTFINSLRNPNWLTNNY